MELDDCTLTLKPGDVVIDVGAWHLWDSSKTGCLMAFDMFDAEFVDGPAGTAQGNDKPMRPPDNQKLPAGREAAAPRRRDRSRGGEVEPRRRHGFARRAHRSRASRASRCIACGSSTASRRRSSTRRCTCPNVLVPPRNGSVLNVFTFPPDAAWKGKVGEREVEGVLPGDGRAGRVDLLGRRRRTRTCRRRARWISASCSKARSCSCSTRRK